MAHKKKGKQSKAATVSRSNNKTGSTSQKIVEPREKTSQSKIGNSPAKPSEEDQVQTTISRKDKTLSTPSAPPSILKVSQFLNEVAAEFRKISWPERSQVARETISVLFLVALITILVWGFDLIVGKFVFAPLEHLGRMYGIGGPSGLHIR